MFILQPNVLIYSRIGIFNHTVTEGIILLLVVGITAEVFVIIFRQFCAIQFIKISWAQIFEIRSYLILCNIKIFIVQHKSHLKHKTISLMSVTETVFYHNIRTYMYRGTINTLSHTPTCVNNYFGVNFCNNKINIIFNITIWNLRWIEIAKIR